MPSSQHLLKTNNHARSPQSPTITIRSLIMISIITRKFQRTIASPSPSTTTCSTRRITYSPRNQPFWTHIRNLRHKVSCWASRLLHSLMITTVRAVPSNLSTLGSRTRTPVTIRSYHRHPQTTRVHRTSIDRSNNSTPTRSSSTLLITISNIAIHIKSWKVMCHPHLKKQSHDHQAITIERLSSSRLTRSTSQAAVISSTPQHRGRRHPMRGSILLRECHQRQAAQAISLKRRLIHPLLLRRVLNTRTQHPSRLTTSWASSSSLWHMLDLTMLISQTRQTWATIGSIHLKTRRESFRWTAICHPPQSTLSNRTRRNSTRAQLTSRQTHRSKIKTYWPTAMRAQQWVELSISIRWCYWEQLTPPGRTST